MTEQEIIALQQRLLNDYAQLVDKQQEQIERLLTIVRGLSALLKVAA
jgi:hypothetical protein